MAALNRLAKWRMVFTGWQLGTRSNTDFTAQAAGWMTGQGWKP